jgi:hypothetical protein
MRGGGSETGIGEWTIDGDEIGRGKMRYRGHLINKHEDRILAV